MTLRLLIVAGLAPGLERGPLEVDAGVDAALSALAPAVEVQVPDRLGLPASAGLAAPQQGHRDPLPSDRSAPATAPRELGAVLRFHRLADFEPDNLAAAVPLLAGLRAARGLLEDCRCGRAAAAEAIERLPELLNHAGIAERLREAAAGAGREDGPAPPAAPPAPPAPARGSAAPGRGESALDLLLGSVDLPPDPGGAALAALPLAELLAGAISALAAGSARPPALPPVEQVVAELDRRLAVQLVELCHAGPLRALEEAWRGVALVAEQVRAAPPGSVRLEVLPASREEFLDAFYSEVFTAEHEAPAEVPLAAVVLGYEFDRGPAEIESLRHCARMGQSLSVPFLAAVGSGFWGIRQPQLLANLPDLGRKLQGPEYAKWKGLRAEDATLWLCLTANRYLAREAWAAEAAAGAAPRPLWASGAYALGALLVRGYAAAGSRFPLVGPQPPACLEGGASRPEVVLPDRRLLEIAQAGLAPLAAADGALFFAAVPALHAPPRAAAPAATLSYQLFAGGAAHALERIGHELGPGLPQAEIESRVSRRLLDFLALGEEAPDADEVAIEIEADAQGHGQLGVMARLRPRFQVSGAPVDLVLGSTVGR